MRRQPRIRPSWERAVVDEHELQQPGVARQSDCPEHERRAHVRDEPEAGARPAPNSLGQDEVQTLREHRRMYTYNETALRELWVGLSLDLWVFTE